MQSNLAQQSNNDNSDFLPGDVVVYMNHIKQLVHRDDIRSANVAELDAGKRLGGGV